MSKTFNTAVEASEIVRDLHSQHLRLPHNSDIYRLISNISTMVTNLSKMEVAARNVRNVRNHSAKLAVENCKQEIEQAIKHVQHLLLMAKLMA